MISARARRNSCHGGAGADLAGSSRRGVSRGPHLLDADDPGVQQAEVAAPAQVVGIVYAGAVGFAARTFLWMVLIHTKGRGGDPKRRGAIHPEPPLNCLVRRFARRPRPRTPPPSGYDDGRRHCNAGDGVARYRNGVLAAGREATASGRNA